MLAGCVKSHTGVALCWFYVVQCKQAQAAWSLCNRGYWKKSRHVLIWEHCLLVWFFYYSLLQDAESKSETSQAISAREHFVFTDTDGQVYHITVEGNTVKDGARIPPDVSLETMCPFYVCSYFMFTWTTSRSSTLILAQSYSCPLHISPSPVRLIFV